MTLYTVTNSQKGGFFMRTYNRNVRRVWDGAEYKAAKRQKTYSSSFNTLQPTAIVSFNDENHIHVEVEDSLERAIRETSVAALSSSPSRKNSTVFSYNDAPEGLVAAALTPPSSPPHQLDITPPVIKARKPTFSTLDKRKSKAEEKKDNKRKRDHDSDHQPEPATESERPKPPVQTFNSISLQVPQSTGFQAINNAPQPVQPPHSASTPAPKPIPPKVLTQSILDFGQSTSPITCTQCQMSYTPSVPEDVSLHNMYHNRNKDGIELTKPFLKSAMKWCYEVPTIPGSVVVVDRKISVPARKTVHKLLEVINKELGSVDIPEAELWGQISLEGDSEDAKKVDHYKVFLHVIDGKCVGLCLAERISKAYRVKSMSSALRDGRVAQDSDNKEESALLTPTSSGAPVTALQSSADIEHEEIPSTAIVGVSRIWTSKNFRRKGIANNLLDCVIHQFIYGMEIDPSNVAFSQPTDAGAVLAKTWFGEATGWSVYREEAPTS